jgi:hypothetical protein
MLNFFCAIFFGIGLVASTIAISSALFSITEKIKDRAKRREDDLRRLISTVERIDLNTRNLSNKG